MPHSKRYLNIPAPVTSFIGPMNVCDLITDIREDYSYWKLIHFGIPGYTAQL
jgi:hypothetical protein